GADEAGVFWLVDRFDHVRDSARSRTVVFDVALEHVADRDDAGEERPRHFAHGSFDLPPVAEHSKAGDVGLDMPLESEVAAAIGVIDGVGLLAVEPGCVRVRVQAEVLPAALRRPGSRTAVITPAAYYEGSVRGR